MTNVSALARGGSGARSLALWLLVVYLAASGVLLAIDAHFALLAMHAGLIGVAIWSAAPRGITRRSVGDLLPLIVAPLLYGEIPLLIAAAGSPFHDVLIQHWELALFGTQPSRVFVDVTHVTWVSELLHAGYLAYYPLIFVPSLLLFLRDEQRGLAETVLASTITYLVCWTVFVAAPVEGPRYLWGAANAPDGPVRRFTVRLLAAGSSRGAAFPSSHVAVSVVQTVLAWRWQPRTVRCAVAIIAGLVGLGAVYGGFHYAVDVIAGAVLGACVGTLVLTFGSTEEPLV